MLKIKFIAAVAFIGFTGRMQADTFTQKKSGFPKGTFDRYQAFLSVDKLRPCLEAKEDQQKIIDKFFSDRIYSARQRKRIEIIDRIARTCQDSASISANDQDKPATGLSGSERNELVQLRNQLAKLYLGDSVLFRSIDDEAKIILRVKEIVAKESEYAELAAELIPPPTALTESGEGSVDVKHVEPSSTPKPKK